MNIILLHEIDFIETNIVQLSDYRFNHIRNILKKKPGESVRIGLLNSKMGSGEITHIDESSCTIKCTLNIDPPAPLNLRLVLALPRPKMFKRTLHTITSLGIKEIFIINTWKVDKSYWQSPYLEEKSINATFFKALEQSCDTIMPSIAFKKLFRPFTEDELPHIIKDSISLVAHPQEEPYLSKTDKKITLAIGPEGGFNDFEISLLKQIGFSGFTTGQRILRVEDAVPAIIGSLML